jgi:hypothetical protein
MTTATKTYTKSELRAILANAISYKRSCNGNTGTARMETNKAGDKYRVRITIEGKVKYTQYESNAVIAACAGARKMGDYAIMANHMKLTGEWDKWHKRNL